VVLALTIDSTDDFFCFLALQIYTNFSEKIAKISVVELEYITGDERLRLGRSDDLRASCYWVEFNGHVSAKEPPFRFYVRLESGSLLRFGHSEVRMATREYGSYCESNLCWGYVENFYFFAMDCHDVLASERLRSPMSPPFNTNLKTGATGDFGASLGSSYMSEWREFILFHSVPASAFRQPRES